MGGQLAREHEANCATELFTEVKSWPTGSFEHGFCLVGDSFYSIATTNKSIRGVMIIISENWL